MRAANDFPLPGGAQYVAHHAVSLGSAFGRNTSRVSRGSLDHERGGGGHLFPRFRVLQSVSQAPHLGVCRSFLEPSTCGQSGQTGSQGEDSRLSSLDLKQLRGRGQNCFVIALSDLSWEVTNPLPVPPSGAHLEFYFLRVCLDPSYSFGDRVIRHCLDQSDCPRLRRADLLRRHKHFQSDGLADQPWQTLRAAPSCN